MTPELFLHGNTVYATENVHLSKQCESPVTGTVSSNKMEILVGKINSTEESSNEASSCSENVKQAGHDETITLDTASTNDMEVSIAQIDTTEKSFGSMEQTVQHEALTLDTTSTEIEGPAKSSKDDLSGKGDSDMFLRQKIINLKSKDLSRNWISVVVPVGVLFLYYSEGMSYGTRTVLIKWDMTTEVRKLLLQSDINYKGNPSLSLSLSLACSCSCSQALSTVANEFTC